MRLQEYQNAVQSLPYGKRLPNAVYIYRGDGGLVDGSLGIVVTRLSEMRGISVEYLGTCKLPSSHGTMLNTMTQEHRLLERLRLIEALHAGAATPGERDAAANARERIKARLAALQKNSDPPVEFSFKLRDRWSHRLLVALLRRYGIAPYRFRGQRSIRVPWRSLAVETQHWTVGSNHECNRM